MSLALVPWPSKLSMALTWSPDYLSSKEFNVIVIVAPRANNIVNTFLPYPPWWSIDPSKCQLNLDQRSSISSYLLTIPHDSTGFIFLLKLLKHLFTLRVLKLISKLHFKQRLVAFVLIMGEYCSTKLIDYVKTNGIRCQFTIDKTLQQNEVVHRKENQTLIEVVRCISSKTKVLAFLWDKFFRMAIYL